MRALLKTERVRQSSLVNYPVFDFTKHEFRSVRSFLSQQFFNLVPYNLARNALLGANGRMQFFFTVLDIDYLIPEEILDGTISDFIPFIREADPNKNVVNVLIRLRG